MEFKGTKEDWKVTSESYITTDSEEFAMCKVFGFNEENPKITTTQAKANIKVMVTAPELLKELTKIKFDIDMGVINVRRDSPIYKGIINVINKATTI